MKTWQERVFDEIRRLDAVNVSMLEIVNQAGGPAGPLSEARGKVCDAIVILVKLDKDERAQTEAEAKAAIEREIKANAQKVARDAAQRDAEAIKLVSTATKIPKRGGKKE